MVTVRQPDGSRVSKRFKPDFALREGPEPQDVEQFDAMLVWKEGEERYQIPQGTTLIPGETYELVATAVDKLGRTFSTRSPTHPIPPTRLNINAENFEPVESPPAGGQRQQDALQPPPRTSQFRAGPPLSDFVDDEGYRLTATYGDPRRKGGPPSQDEGGPSGAAGGQGARPSATQDQGSRPGPGGGAGNRPGTAPGLGQGVRPGIEGELSGKCKIGPGDTEALEVTVKDRLGRTWSNAVQGNGSHSSQTFKLPPERLQVNVENGRYDPADSEVEFNENARSMLGKQFGVTVTYEPPEQPSPSGEPPERKSESTETRAETPQTQGSGATGGKSGQASPGNAAGPMSLAAERKFNPDFLKIVPLMKESTLQYSGRNGQEGRGGRPGRAGSPGSDAMGVMERGTDGRNGGNGSPGQAGARGSKGPHLRVVAREVRTVLNYA